MIDENEELNQRLESNYSDSPKVVSRGLDSQPSPTQPHGQFDYAQWQVGANDAFRPGAKTKAKLPFGVYRFDSDNMGLIVRRVAVQTDSLIPLPDSASLRVLESIRRFWQSENLYTQHGLLYKRGILLWGPPGSGKTVTLQLLFQGLKDHGGIIVLCDHPELTVVGLEAIRRIEPKRPLIVVMEDVDETIARHGEHSLLALLDGETQIQNVVNIATTNYPERLGARIVNRPSRFDERVLIDMPSAEARRAYLHHAIKVEKEIGQIERWTADTKGFSIAHLRELVAAVFCLEQEYEPTLKRLQSMMDRPKDVEGFRKGKMNFLATGD